MYINKAYLIIFNIHVHLSYKIKINFYFYIIHLKKYVEKFLKLI